MKKTTQQVAVPASKSITVPFHLIRNISSSLDQSENRIIYAGQMPITSVVEFSTSENVRGYLVEAEGKTRRTRSQVHKAIRETLDEHPSTFGVLNSGIVLIAAKVDIDEPKRTLTLQNASIINGSQTQGVVREFISQADENVKDIYIKFELIITNDDDLVANISIARNFQNDVESISIAGRKGELNELEEAMKEFNGDARLKKSESERPSSTNDIIQTEKLLQVIAALLPPSLWREWKQGDCNKTYTYSAKATCLKEFRHIYSKAKNEDETFKKIYKFYLDIAGEAWDLYWHWKENQAFQGTGLRSIERDGKEIVEVPDGIVFPILAALSEFAVNQKGKWTIRKPKQLEDSELVNVAKRAYMEIAKSKPEIMGKTRACYSSLEQITSIYSRLLNPQ